MGNKIMDPKEELKKINIQRKELIAKQRELLKLLNESKDEQAEIKKAIIQNRKGILQQKGVIRKRVIQVKEIVRSRDTEEIEKYIRAVESDHINWTDLLKAFARNTAELEDL